MTKIFLICAALVFAISAKSQSKNPLQLEKGQRGIIITETQSLFVGSNINIGTNEKGNITVTIKNPIKHLLSADIGNTVAEKEVNVCDALNSLGFALNFTCFKGEINNVTQAGAGTLVVECLPSDKICFVGVENPL